jgi:hypothetical protein
MYNNSSSDYRVGKQLGENQNRETAIIPLNMWQNSNTWEKD